MKTVNCALILCLAVGIMACTEPAVNTPEVGDEPKSETGHNPDPAHTSQNSLDYFGSYSGTLPCADCEGIQTVLELNEDETFVRTLTYLGKPEPNVFTEEGTYYWNEAGTEIQLEGATGANKYKVGENMLWQLDLTGQRITGELAEYYMLRK